MDGMDVPCSGDLEDTYISIKLLGIEGMPLTEFVAIHGCAVDILDVKPYPAAVGGRQYFTRSFLERMRGLAVVEGGTCEKRNGYSCKFEIAPGANLDLSRLRFSVERWWHDIHEHIDYVQAELRYDRKKDANEGTEGRERGDSASSGGGGGGGGGGDEAGKSGFGVTLDDRDNYWDGGCEEEGYVVFQPIETHTSFHFAAAECINRWAKRCLASRQLMLRRAWQTVLIGSLCQALSPAPPTQSKAAGPEPATPPLELSARSAPAVAEKVADAESLPGATSVTQRKHRKDNHLWMLGPRGRQQVREFLGVL